MPAKIGTRLQAGESLSEKYSGLILRRDGTYRRPRKWVNKKGKDKTVNSYMKEVVS